MAEETDLVAQYLTSTIAADSSGVGSLGLLSTTGKFLTDWQVLHPAETPPPISDRIYDSVADEEEEIHPVIVFNMMDSRELLAAGGDTVFVGFIWQVQVVGKNHAYSELSPLSDRIKTLLHKTRGSVTGGRIISCVRSDTAGRSIVRYNEVIGGVDFRHLGAFYRIQAQST